MKTRCFVFVLVLIAAGSMAAQPVYLDELMETPVTQLRRYFPDLKAEGCYRIGEQRFALLSIEKKDQKPWRLILTSVEPCRRPIDVASFDLRVRNGVELGDSSVAVVERIGRPDVSAEPDAALRRLGDTEYFYICRVDEGCARHTSIIFRSGLVSAIGEWYSQ